MYDNKFSKLTTELLLPFYLNLICYDWFIPWFFDFPYWSSLTEPAIELRGTSSPTTELHNSQQRQSKNYILLIKLLL